MNTRTLVLAVALFSSLLLAGTAHAKTVFRISHTLAPSSHYNQGLMYLDKLLQEKSNNQMALDIYHSSQLGSERDAVEGVTMGTLEMTLSSTGPLTNFTNAFMVFDLPFVISDRQKAYTWMDGPEGQKILDSVAKQNLVGLAFFENGFRHLTNSKQPVLTPRDAKGLKIRLMENAIHIATFKALNAYPTPMPFGELFTAMQQKTVDGQENPLVIISTSNFYEVQQHLAITGHFYSPAILFINKDVWEGLTEEQRTIMRECVAKARDWERKLSMGMDAKLTAQLQEKGMQITEPDKTAWRAFLAPVYKEFEAKIGKDVIQSLIEAQK